MKGHTLLAISLLILVGCGEEGVESSAARLIAVRVDRPVVRDVESRFSYVGIIHSSQEVRVISRVQGTVSDLPVSEGGRVQKGDPVAVLDVPDLRAVVERIRADRDYWCRRYEADRRLVEAEALPQEQAEASRRACRSARAGLAEAEARLAKAREVSPVTGTVLSHLAEPGQHMMPGQPLLVLGDDALEIHVEVVEEDLGHGIQVGTPVVVYGEGKASVRSTISEISPISSGRARTFTVKFPVPSNTWRWGASARVDFILASRPDRLTVPVEAVFGQNGDRAVFLVREDRAVYQTVTTGIAQDGRIEVAFPWNGEDPVAVSNLSRLADGVAVFAVEAEGGKE